MPSYVTIAGRNISKRWLAVRSLPVPAKCPRYSKPRKRERQIAALKAELDRLVAEGVFTVDSAGRYGLPEWNKQP